MSIDGYIQRHLIWTDRDLKTHRVPDHQLPDFDQPMVILGPPGMGKTYLMENLSEQEGMHFVRATSFLRWNSSSLEKDCRLVIDGLDEVASVEEGDPLHNVLKKLAQFGNPRFILSCRSAEWSSVTAKSDILEDYGETPLELTLEPLTRDNALEVLSRGMVQNKASDALDELDQANLSDMYANPLTLGFVSAIIESDGNIPTTRAGLYERAVRKLRLEPNPRHKKTNLAKLSEEAALDAAGAAMAALLITGKDALVLSTNQIDHEILATAEMSGLADIENIEAVLGSNMFKSDGVDHARFVPLHRTIAEYLGARWLARKINDIDYQSRTIVRFLGLISADGGVPASLRGIHAWLAHFSPMQLGPKIIAADPYGVLRYGDADDLSVAQGRHMLDALKTLSVVDPYFRSDHWQRFSAKGLAQPDLQDDIRQILTNAEISVDLKSLLLECLKGSKLAEPLIVDLLAIMHNPKKTFHERSASGEALSGLPGTSVNWPEVIKKLIDLADDNSTRLAVDFLVEAGLEHFDDTLISDAVIAETGILRVSEDDERRRVSGTLHRLSREIPDERIIGILNAITARILPTRDMNKWWNNNYSEARREISSFADSLIVRQLDHNKEIVTAQQLWNWLCALKSDTSYDHSTEDAITAHLKYNEKLRRDIQRLALFQNGSENKFSSHSYYLTRLSSGLQIQDSDALEFLTDISQKKHTIDKERWKILLAHFRNAEGIDEDIQTIARPYAEGDPELIEYLTSMSKRRTLSDWEIKEKRRRRVRKKQEEKERAINRKVFSEHIGEIRLGAYQWIYNPARAYLGMFSDLKREATPIERIHDWLGDELQGAVTSGFEAVLHRDDLPTAQQISKSYAKSERWNFVFPMIAGAGYRMSTGVGFSDLSSELLSAISIAVENEHLEQHQGFEGLQNTLHEELRRRGEAYEAYIRQKFEPQFIEKQTHIPGLYAFVRSVDDQPLSFHLAAEWIVQFPDLPLEIERELIECLINTPEAERSYAWQILISVAKQKLKTELNDDDEFRLWASVLFTLDFNEALAFIPPINSANREWLWSLNSWFYDRYERAKTLPATSVNQLKWIFHNFRSVWPVVPRPNGVTSGSHNPWDATRLLEGILSKLASDPSDDAASALVELRGMSEDKYTIMIQSYIARQRRICLETNFKTPSLTDLKAALTNEPPMSASDLQSIVLDELGRLQKRLRGDALNLVNNFYTDEGKPRTENECRDQMLITLGSLPFGIQTPPETAMPQGKRSDGAFTYNDILVPLETKGQWHKDVWTAAATQLDRLYTSEHKAASKGIYVVFWFGTDAPAGKRLKLPPNDLPKPQSNNEMRTKLEGLLPQYRRGDIAIIVLDLTRP